MTEVNVGEIISSKFLVIGVTGPLNSGCSTFSDFIVNKQKNRVNSYEESGTQEKINFNYRKIKEMVDKEGTDTKQINESNDQLKLLLKRREVYKTLNKYAMPEYCYISMSKMLLKYSIEYLLRSRKRKYDSKYDIIINEVKERNFCKARIVKINGWIIKKRYRLLKEIECKYYDEYLHDIDGLYKSLKSKYDSNILGRILQDMGDNIRRSGNPFSSSSEFESFENVTKIAQEANLIIKYFRNRQDGKRIHHFILENFRNPYEVEFFRYRYYEFYLVALNSDKNIRRARSGFSEERDLRDQGSGAKIVDYYKQNVAKCVYLADMVINNNSSLDDLFDKWLHYFSLIVKPGTITPTSSEQFMNQACSMAVKSSCISRQVGAIIVGKNGYVIGAGWNDAGEGQIGCGYRQILDLKHLDNDTLVTNSKKDESFRRLLRIKVHDSYNFCFKDEYSRYEVKKKLDKFMENKEDFFKKYKLLKDDQKMLAEWLVDEIKIKRLEYCRALHAEENALLQSSKIGGLGVSGGTIYTTSFPCELCAKKIFQSGIAEVIYVEPYPESISQDVILRDGPRRVKLTPFEGVMSHSYFRLYKPSVDKKEYQQLTDAEIRNS